MEDEIIYDEIRVETNDGEGCTIQSFNGVTKFEENIKNKTLKFVAASRIKENTCIDVEMIYSVVVFRLKSHTTPTLCGIPINELAAIILKDVDAHKKSFDRIRQKVDNTKQPIIYDSISVETIEKFECGISVARTTFYNVTKLIEDSKTNFIKITTIEPSCEYKEIELKSCIIKQRKTHKKTGAIRVYMDGNMWCAVREKTFINIQESNCGFSDTPQHAIDALFIDEEFKD